MPIKIFQKTATYSFCMIIIYLVRSRTMDGKICFEIHQLLGMLFRGTGIHEFVAQGSYPYGRAAVSGWLAE